MHCKEMQAALQDSEVRHEMRVMSGRRAGQTLWRGLWSRTGAGASLPSTTLSFTTRPSRAVMFDASNKH